MPLRLTVVIDISHSMSEPYGADDQMSKLDKVKLFAQLLAATMDEEDYMGIVTFGTVAQIVMPLTKMDPEAKVNFDHSMVRQEALQCCWVRFLSKRTRN